VINDAQAITLRDKRHSERALSAREETKLLVLSVAHMEAVKAGLNRLM